MNNAINALLLLSSSEDEEDKVLVVQRQVFRQQRNIFELPDSKFLNYFRFSKSCFRDVLHEILPKLHTGRRSLALTPEVKLATALRFLAQGSYQTSAGNDFNISLAQPTVSIVLKEVFDACEATICRKWVKASMTEEEMNEAKEYFFTKFGIPGVIGCVEGTHIKIISSGSNDANLYFNRKGFYSLNATVVCDHKMRIRFFDGRYGGSAHDSLVWNMSAMKTLLQERYDAGERNSWLLGDAGYPLQPYLMTPYRSSADESRELNFNSKHAKARNIVERTIGLLKSRFRCLLGARELHYSPQKATQIANVCVALHNRCIEFQVEHLEEVDSITMQEQNDEGEVEVENAHSTEARRIRDNIRDNLF